MILQIPENPGRDMLPRSLFPRKFIRIADHNPDELKRLAEKPQKILPLPEDKTELQRRRLVGLAQYGGRTPEGNARSLAAFLARNEKVETLASGSAPEVPAGIPKPAVPTAVPQVPTLHTLRGKLIRRILSREEYDLYVETWNEWYKEHADWDKPEDQDDVHTICLETVVQFRLQSAQLQKPGLNIAEDFNQSYKRKQKARENLAARRVDRVGTKASGGGGANINIAVLAGSITPEMEAQRKRQIMKDDRDQLEFLQGTILTPNSKISNEPIIDAEVVG